MAENLGIISYTGEPKGEAGFITSELNHVGLTGRFPRIFQTVQMLKGNEDRQFILGSPQASKNDWYIVDDAIKNARNTPIFFHMYSYNPVDAAQAEVTIQDRATVPLDTLKLKASYKDNDSKGVWDNDTCVRFQTGIKFSIKLAAATAISATTYYLNSVVGLVIGDIIRIGTDSMRVLTINENDSSITVALDGATPAFLGNETIDVMGFKILSYRKQSTGQILSIETGFEDRWLSMEVTNIKDYFVTALETHPLFKGEDLSSASLGLKKIPADTALNTYIFLTGGLDGTAPATVSDWETVQPKYLNRRLTMFMNTGTVDKDVHKNFRDWMKTFPKFPEYVQALDDFSNDWQSLRDLGQEFLSTSGWNMAKLVYGYRYVSDPLSPSPRRIPVIGKYLGVRMYMVYNGNLHRSPADRTLNVTLTNDVSGGVVYEDKVEVWDETVRTTLYDAGINLIQYIQGIGLIMRNDRFPTNDFKTRDGHIHWVNKCIEFLSEDNLKPLENTPLKRARTLQKAKMFIEDNILKPLHNGNLIPFVVSDESGKSGSGAFIDEKEDGTPAEWYDVSRVKSDITNNPQSQFETGKAIAEVMYVTYSLLNKMRIPVYPVSLSFFNN
jgi:hypothetical protein